MFKTKNNKTGEDFYLLNPSEKGKKYAKELKDNTHYTNDFKKKKDNYGNETLTVGQKAYRSGYLSARNDNAKAYKANKEKKEKKLILERRQKIKHVKSENRFSKTE